MFNYAKKIFNGARELINRPNYFKPQLHKVIFSAEIENTSNNKNDIIFILPIPPDVDYQLIKTESEYNPKDYHIGFDDKFGNSYVYWRLVISSGITQSFESSFTAFVSPRKKTINHLWRLKDYNYIKNTANYSIYIKSNKYLGGNDHRIKAMSNEILEKNDNLAKIALDSYEFTLKFLNYANPITGLYPFDEILEKKDVDCGGFVSFLGSLYLSMGIPARVVSGFWADSFCQTCRRGKAGVYPVETSKKMHAWLEILLPDGEWFPMDPSVDYLRRLNRTSRYGGFGFVGSDRIAFSFGEEIPIKVGSKNVIVDILQNPVIIADKGIDRIEIKTNFIVEKSQQ